MTRHWPNARREARAAGAQASLVPRGEASDMIGARLARAEERLADVAEGRPLCDLSGGVSPMTVKEAEGRVVALVELRRRGADRLAEVLEDWETALAATGETDRVWYTYRRGGVDELRAAMSDQIDRHRAIPGRLSSRE